MTNQDVAQDILAAQEIVNAGSIKTQIQVWVSDGHVIDKFIMAKQEAVQSTDQAAVDAMKQSIADEGAIVKHWLQQIVGLL